MTKGFLKQEVKQIKFQHFACTVCCAMFPSLFFMTHDPKSGLGLIVVRVSRSHTIRRTTRGMIPLNEESAHRRRHYLHSSKNIRDELPYAQRESDRSIPAMKGSRLKHQTARSPALAVRITFQLKYCVTTGSHINRMADKKLVEKITDWNPTGLRTKE